MERLYPILLLKRLVGSIATSRICQDFWSPFGRVYLSSWSIVYEPLDLLYVALENTAANKPYKMIANTFISHPNASDARNMRAGDKRRPRKNVYFATHGHVVLISWSVYTRMNTIIVLKIPWGLVSEKTSVVISGIICMIIERIKAIYWLTKNQFVQYVRIFLYHRSVYHITAPHILHFSAVCSIGRE